MKPSPIRTKLNGTTTKSRPALSRRRLGTAAAQRGPAVSSTPLPLRCQRPPALPSGLPAAGCLAPLGSSSSFNPTQPEDGALIIAEVLRDQFNALNDDIQTRAREVTLAADVASLQAQLQDRPTYPEMNGAISTAVADKVSQAELGIAISSAISGTAVNPSSISPLSLTISDPPTQYEVQQMVDWMNNLFAGLYRAP